MAKGSGGAQPPRVGVLFPPRGARGFGGVEQHVPGCAGGGGGGCTSHGVWRLEVCRGGSGLPPPASPTQSLGTRPSGWTPPGLGDETGCSLAGAPTGRSGHPPPALPPFPLPPSLPPSFLPPIHPPSVHLPACPSVHPSCIHQSPSLPPTPWPTADSASAGAAMGSTGAGPPAALPQHLVCRTQAPPSE